MRIRRYVAGTMQQAVAMVKADFGDDAVILHTKRFRRGGLFGLFGVPKVEVIAAVEPGRPLQHRHQATRQEAQLEQARQTTAATLETLQEEVRSLRQLIGDHTRGEDLLPKGVRPVFARLRAQEFPESDCYRLIEEVIEDADPVELDDPSVMWERMTAHLAASIKTVPPWEFGGEPIVAPLVGPTGVGKTTTIAKLAANFSILAEAKVGLVTVDTYRIAAVQQLRTYANIIGIDLQVAYSPDELREAVDKLADKDLILIDTAGRSQMNAMHMGELRSFLEVLPSPEVHLVVGATTRTEDMWEIAGRFGETGFDRLIVTKLDETSFYGSLYRLPQLTGKPLSYLTTGQDVPDDIDAADGEHVARLIMGDGP